MLTLLIGLAVTAALTVISAALANQNEQRLLKGRLREVEAILAPATQSIQTPLASAEAIADVTRGRRGRFEQFIHQFVGTGAGRPFASVSLWRLDAVGRGPVAVVGARPEITGAAASRIFSRSGPTNELRVIAMLGGRNPRIGYGYTASGPSRYAVYGESLLAEQRVSPTPPDSAFSDLDYAVYLGNTQSAQSLLAASTAKLPLAERRVAGTVPFGDTHVTLVIGERRALSGGLPHSLPWIILGLGSLLTLLAVALMGRLVQGRENARRLAIALEQVAAQNRRLYGEQRDIAQTLQHSLLPERLPSIDGLEISARYLAGERGVEIGGDWYDVIRLDAERVLMVVGDVSGRGLRAAATMALLRHAIQAYATECESPSEILSKLSRLLDVGKTGKLATAMCARIEISTRAITIASAGHLPALLIGEGTTSLLSAPVGPPIGMEQGAAYAEASFSAPPGAAILLFTDGLVERRGESLDRGLDRLRRAANLSQVDLEQIVGRVLERMRGNLTEDDTAIVGIRWTDGPDPDAAVKTPSAQPAAVPPAPVTPA